MWEEEKAQEHSREASHCSLRCREGSSIEPPDQAQGEAGQGDVVEVSEGSKKQLHLPEEQGDEPR